MAKELPERVSVRDQSVILVDGTSQWPADLVASITREGYETVRIEDLALAPSFLRKGKVKALIVSARPFGAKDLLILRDCRAIAPQTAVVVMATAPTQPDLKRAFESGATSYLSWPVTSETVRQALRSGVAPSGAAPFSSRKRCEP